jgi:hypothetical protein
MFLLMEIRHGIDLDQRMIAYVKNRYLPSSEKEDEVEEA